MMLITVWALSDGFLEFRHSLKIFLKKFMGFSSLNSTKFFSLILDIDQKISNILDKNC